jgi:hypothetical protein
MNTARRLTHLAAIAVALAAGGAAAAERATRPATRPAGKPLTVHMISGSREHKSEPSLTAFKAYLAEHYGVRRTVSLGKDKGTELPNLEALDAADVMLVFYTSTGLPTDFENDNFRELLVNALFWVAKRPVPPAKRLARPLTPQRPADITRVSKP